MKKDKKTTMNRLNAAKYLGTTSTTLKKLPIPYVQYYRLGSVTYKKSDLEAFKEKHTHKPNTEVLID